LTDVEIRELTKYFLDHTTEDRGVPARRRAPIVLEVAFNNVQRSERHDSGFALRFRERAFAAGQPVSGHRYSRACPRNLLTLNTRNAMSKL